MWVIWQDCLISWMKGLILSYSQSTNLFHNHSGQTTTLWLLTSFIPTILDHMKLLWYLSLKMAKCCSKQIPFESFFQNFHPSFIMYSLLFPQTLNVTKTSTSNLTDTDSRVPLPDNYWFFTVHLQVPIWLKGKWYFCSCAECQIWVFHLFKYAFINKS